MENNDYKKWCNAHFNKVAGQSNSCEPCLKVAGTVPNLQSTPALPKGTAYVSDAALSHLIVICAATGTTAFNDLRNLITL